MLTRNAIVTVMVTVTMVTVMVSDTEEGADAAVTMQRRNAAAAPNAVAANLMDMDIVIIIPIMTVDVAGMAHTINSNAASVRLPRNGRCSSSTSTSSKKNEKGPRRR